MKSATSRALLLLWISVALYGCGEDGISEPIIPDYLPRTSADNVLENFVKATERRDFETYRNQLDPAFQFHYRPDDVGHSDMPTLHDLSTELCAAKVVFADPRVDTLWIQMGVGAGSAVIDSSAPSRAIWQIDFPDADVGLSGPWPDSDVIVQYLNYGTPQRFLFAADTLASGEVNYSLLRHYEFNDQPAPLLPGDRFLDTPGSWGRLKHNMILVSQEPGGPCSH